MQGHIDGNTRESIYTGEKLQGSAYTQAIHFTLLFHFL